MTAEAQKGCCADPVKGLLRSAEGVRGLRMLGPVQRGIRTIVVRSKDLLGDSVVPKRQISRVCRCKRTSAGCACCGDSVRMVRSMSEDTNSLQVIRTRTSTCSESVRARVGAGNAREEENFHRIYY